MTSERVTDLLQALDRATGYQRLVLLVGLPGAGKTHALRTAAGQRGFPVLNVNLELAGRLMDYAREERPRILAKQLTEALEVTGSDTLGLDNLELLFSPELKLRPLPLLLDLSRHRCLVATWSGTLNGGQLTYARPGHPEYQQEPQPTCPILNFNADPAETP